MPVGDAGFVGKVKAKVNGAVLSTKAKAFELLALMQATVVSTTETTKGTAEAYASSAKAKALAAVDATKDLGTRTKAAATSYTDLAQAKTTAAVGAAKAKASGAIAKARGILDDARATATTYAASGKAKVAKAADDAKEKALEYVPTSVKVKATGALEAVSKGYATVMGKVQQAQTTAMASASSAQARATDVLRRTVDTAARYIPAPVAAKAVEVRDYTLAKKAAAAATAASAKATLDARLNEAVDCTKTKAQDLATEAKAIAADPKYQVAAASAAGGAVTLGTTGGAVGLTAGGAMGAALGVVPALFTFGLSIPIGAAIGGGAGLCVGTVTGGTAGLVTGGAAGFAGYAKKDQISGGASGAFSKVGSATEAVKAKAISSTEFVKGRVPARLLKTAGYVAEKARFVVSDSGSTGNETAMAG